MRPATAALLGVLGAAALGAGLLFGRDTPATQEVEVGQLAFPASPQGCKRRRGIEVVRGDRTLVVQKSGDRWVLPDKGGYPVQVEKLRGVLTGLTELRLVEARTSDPAQWGRLGLDDPRSASGTAILLRVLDGSGAPIAEAVLGHRRVRMGGNVPEQIFVRLPGQQGTWLAEGRLAVDADPQLWLDRDVADIPNARMAEARAARGNAVVEVARVDGKPALRQPVEHGPLEEYRVEDVFRAFETLTFTDVQPAATMPGEPVGTAVFTTGDGLRIEVAGNRAGEQFWVKLAASGAGSEPLQARWAGWAYQLGQWKEKQLLPRLEDLLATPPAPSGEAPPGGDAAAPPAGGAAPAPPRRCRGERTRAPGASPVGIGIVVLRPGADRQPEVLLVRRDRPPALGQWSLPGGAQELGETAEDGARRELLEETGLRVGPLVLVANVDSIHRDGEGRVQWHYTILDFAAAWDGGEPAAAGDVSAATWVPASRLADYGVWSEAERVIALASVRLGM